MMQLLSLFKKVKELASTNQGPREIQAFPDRL